MFKSAQVGTALLFLSQDAKAVKVSYRPISGTAPWSKSGEETTGPNWLVPTWPVNYAVPNFGVDHDIVETQQSIGASEVNLGHSLTTAWKKPEAPKRNYFVPNFGVDRDIKMTELNINEAEAQHGHVIAVETPADIKRDYRIPNFGQDREILASDESLAQAEGMVGSKFDAKSLEQPAEWPHGYAVPNFGQDREITESLANTANTEAQLNHVWNVDAVQLENEANSDVRIMDDPYMSSLGKVTQFKFPEAKEDNDPWKPAKVNYAVPSFGKDPDMEGTMNSVRVAEEQVNHKLVMGTDDSKAKWHTVAKDTLYNYHPALDKDIVDTQHHLASSEDRLGTYFVQLRSDPITDSTGEVTQYTHPESDAKKWKMNYPVPNFGVDREILDQQDNLDKTEKELGHVFTPTKSDGDKPYTVPNFGVDNDIKDAAASISAAEQTHGPWDPKQDDNGVWIVPQPIDASSYSHSAGHVDHYVQLDAMDDPIGSSIGITEYPLPKPFDPLAPAKINYVVPNFGPDREATESMASIASAEKQENHKLVMGTDDSKAKWHIVAKDTLYDYNPPLEDSIKTTWKNLEAAEDKLGVTFEDANLLQSDPITSSLSKITQYKYPGLPDDPLAPAKVNYPVPDFGKDPDMVGTMNSIAIGEKMNSHKFVMGTADSKAKWHNVAKDTLYDYYPSLDKDVISTNRHLAEAEDRLGTTMIQLRSDPITDSTGEVTQYTHPEGTHKKWKMNYPVPNFGVDSEIENVKASIEGAEDSLKHKWNPVEVDAGKIIEYPHGRSLDADMQSSLKSLSDTQSQYGTWDLVQLNSDPITSSLGKITQYTHPDPADDPWAPAKIDYPVNNFGVDPDIIATQNSIKITESELKHKLVMGTADSKAKWHNVAKDTLYDYHPKLDGDVIVTNRNIDSAENLLGHTYGAE